MQSAQLWYLIMPLIATCPLPKIATWQWKRIGKMISTTSVRVTDRAIWGKKSGTLLCHTAYPAAATAAEFMRFQWAEINTDADTTSPPAAGQMGPPQRCHFGCFHALRWLLHPTSWVDAVDHHLSTQYQCCAILQVWHSCAKIFAPLEWVSLSPPYPC